MFGGSLRPHRPASYPVHDVEKRVGTVALAESKQRIANSVIVERDISLTLKKPLHQNVTALQTWSRRVPAIAPSSWRFKTLWPAPFPVHDEEKKCRDRGTCQDRNHECKWFDGGITQKGERQKLGTARIGPGDPAGANSGDRSAGPLGYFLRSRIGCVNQEWAAAVAGRPLSPDPVPREPVWGWHEGKFWEHSEKVTAQVGRWAGLEGY